MIDLEKIVATKMDELSEEIKQRKELFAHARAVIMQKIKPLIEETLRLLKDEIKVPNYNVKDVLLNEKTNMLQIWFGKRPLTKSKTIDGPILTITPEIDGTVCIRWSGTWVETGENQSIKDQRYIEYNDSDLDKKVIDLLLEFIKESELSYVVEKYQELILK
jgi:hypothetical protein